MNFEKIGPSSFKKETPSEKEAPKEESEKVKQKRTEKESEEISPEEKNPEKEEREEEEEMTPKEIEQTNIAHKYLQEDKHYQKLSEKYQYTSKLLDSLREEGISPKDIKEVEDELKNISALMDTSQKYKDNLFDQLSDESKEKYLKPKRPEVKEKPEAEKEEIEQSNIAHEYLQEYKVYQNLSEKYKNTLRQLDSLREERALSYNNDKEIKKIENQLKDISWSMDGSLRYMKRLSDQLSDKSKEKYLRPKGFWESETKERTEAKSEEPKSSEKNYKSATEKLTTDDEKKIPEEEEIQKDKEEIEKLRKKIAEIEQEKLLEKSKEDIEKEKTIAEATDFRDLIVNVLPRIGDITAPDGYVYKNQRLIETINDVRAGRKDINYVTRTYGLRKKVKELLEKQSR